MRAALIDLATGLVENVIVADATIHDAPAGYLLVNSEDANIGDKWDGASIIVNPVSVRPAPASPQRTTPGINPKALEL